MTARHERRALELVRILAGYSCAGIGQEEDDPTLCGQCGPCEARAFLAGLDRSKARGERSRPRVARSGRK